MMNRFLIPLYGFTLFLSAVLVFSVQPMFSKMILPLLGGAPQVWVTSMLFFQVALLFGYAYAHGTTRFLSVKGQSVLHVLLLAFFVVYLPITVQNVVTGENYNNPAVWQLVLMLATVGGPFVILSGTAPMLQRWFAHTGHKDSDNPYFLYGASNLGSMGALLAYPFLIEPFLSLSEQSNYWTYGYILMIKLSFFCALVVWFLGVHSNKNQGNKNQDTSAQTHETITWKRRVLWVTLAFIPSTLMLGVTTYITTDIASVPLLWIMPLALYVGTYIIVFSRKEWISEQAIMTIQPLLLVLALGLFIQNFIGDYPFLFIALHFTLFFFSALACHYYLAKHKPNAAHLTEFYLWMSFGGALGGAINALIVPWLFIYPVEYALALFAVVVITHALYLKDGIITLKRLPRRLFSFEANILYVLSGLSLFAVIFTADEKLSTVLAIGTFAILGILLFMSRRFFIVGCAVILTIFNPGYNLVFFKNQDVLHIDRNFFGPIKIVDIQSEGHRVFLHGTTNHGAQPLDPAYKHEKTTYYAETNPIRDVFNFYDAQAEEQNIAVIGLGVGVVSCYTKPGRQFTYYEIDPDVVAIAENTDYFTYLDHCGSYDIKLGDGRLTLQNATDGAYDLIVGDAFSSDNIPVHLITLEAIELYFSKLKENGVFLIHISNRYLDLEPVLHNIAQELGIHSLAKFTTGKKPKEGPESYSSHYLVMTKNEDILRFLRENGWNKSRPREGVGLWTDQFSNIIKVLGNRTLEERLKQQSKQRAISLP